MLLEPENRDIVSMRDSQTLDFIHPPTQSEISIRKLFYCKMES